MTWSAYGTAYLGLWVQKSGTWSQVTQVSVAVNGTFASGGQKTITYDQSFAVDCGTGAQAFGLTYVGTDSISSSISSFVSVVYSVATPSASRTASIGGTSKSSVTVFPQ